MPSPTSANPKTPTHGTAPPDPRSARLNELHLVSDARPIPWNRLSSFEQDKLRDADAWMKAVRADARRPKPTADQIDRFRSGRVLIIDGARGAGKTSLLLTLLERWQGHAPYTKRKQTSNNLRVLLPILDFDPLPHGMPLHGWLLEPWRGEVARLERGAEVGAQGKDLSELWFDVFEHAVLGWSPVTTEGKGVVEKALAYSEKASGWVDVRSRWYDLVNSAVCRSSGCTSTTCKAEHAFVFIVAIDDVDLQVEQLPQLLHATRLLHHPNVVYVFTGHLAHLRFVLELDYIRRHGTAYRLVDRSADRSYSKTTVVWSHSLCDALLEKALPSHARLTLPAFSLESVLRMHVGGDDDAVATTVSALVDDVWKDIARAMSDRGVVTARRAQHAIDKHFDHANRAGATAPRISQLKFVADVCESTIDERSRILIRGRITTLLGLVFRAWGGDRLSIQLRDPPALAFQPQFDEVDSRVGEEANRAAVIQFAIERDVVRAPKLVWSPDAGVATTEVRWNSDDSNIAGIALFHWPWLARPTVSEMLQFGAVAEEMSRDAGEATDLANLKLEMLLVWLRRNIQWQYERKELRSVRCPALNSLRQIVTALGAMSAHKNEVLKTEALRWIRELTVMTAPYFGLPQTAASDMYGEFERQGLVPGLDELLAEERRMVTNAILVWQLDVARNGGRPFEGKGGPSSPDFDLAATDFLRKRYEVSADNDWWSRQGRVPLQAEPTPRKKGPASTRKARNPKGSRK